MNSLSGQGALPSQLIVVDGSTDSTTRELVEGWGANVASECEVIWQRANHVGAAIQRNQGVEAASQPFVWFFDDDILFETECVKRLWGAIENSNEICGVSAMITNQRYSAPGRVTRTLYRLLDGKDRRSYAGRCIGPAFNILPEDDSSLAEVVPVDWLNTTCTIYRREAMPRPPFESHFTGYSFMEDLALSLTVGKKWKLANARTARIYHDSQPADYKKNRAAIAQMELVNRHYIMTSILGRRHVIDYAKLALLEGFCVATPLVSGREWLSLPPVLLGKATAAVSIICNGSRRATAPGIIEERKSFESS